MLSAQTNSLGRGMRRLQSMTGSIPVPRTTVCAVQMVRLGWRISSLAINVQ